MTKLMPDGKAITKRTNEMSLIKFKEYTTQLSEGMAMDVLGENDEDVVVVEWNEADWKALSLAERTELESEAVNGWAIWAIGDLDKQPPHDEPDDMDGSYVVEPAQEWKGISEFFDMLDEEAELTEECDVCGKEPCDCDANDEKLDEKAYKARNTMKRRSTQKVKDKQKFKNRQGKLKAKIERKKGGNKVKRLKLRKKWMRKNKSKIKNANKVFGGKVHSKFTKKK